MKKQQLESDYLRLFVPTFVLLSIVVAKDCMEIIGEGKSVRNETDIVENISKISANQRIMIDKFVLNEENGRVGFEDCKNGENGRVGLEDCKNGQNASNSTVKEFIYKDSDNYTFGRERYVVDPFEPMTPEDVIYNFGRGPAPVDSNW